MKLGEIVGVLITLIFFSSCSVFKFADNHTKKKLRRGGLEHIVLETENYVFSYWDTGETNKPVYVLFHGFGSSTHLQWFKQAKLLAKTHRLILPNLLHFGSKPKEQEKYKIQDQVEAMSILLKELNIDKMALGGISYGGLVAAELAMLEKDKIEKLTIFSSPVKFFNDDDLSSLEAKTNIEDISELLVPKDLAMMRKLLDVVLYKDKKIPKFILKDIHRNLFQDDKRNANFRGLLNEIQMGKDYFINRNYEFDYPVLLVWGANDELIPPRIGKELKAYIPSSELHLIPRAGHGPNIEQKKLFDKILTEFLNN